MHGRVVALAALLMAASASARQPEPAASTPSSAPVDPARLAAARIVVAKLLPPGAYRTVMNASLGPVLDNIGDSLNALPLRQMAEMGGLDAKQAAALDKVNVERVMAIYDPHWKERMRLTTHAMVDAMADFFTTIEPELREAYAYAYANQFTLANLRDFDAFFATPSGTAFAGRYLTIATDPAIAAEMRAMMPKMMQQMPHFIEVSTKAAATLPPPHKLSDLSAAQRAELAKALGVPETQLHEPHTK